MASPLYLATNDGLAIAEPHGDDWQIVGRGLQGQHVTSVVAREGVVLAGTRQGIFRSDDAGSSWQAASDGLAIAYVRWLAFHPQQSDLEFAGTEPAAIFVSRDGAQTWRECREVAELRDHHAWFLPYSPEAGCVRDFAFAGRRAYAAVEVGGLLRSDDGGASWALAAGSDGAPRMGTPAAGFIHPDVHSVLVHPSSTDLVYCPTGGGLYRSVDGGQTWALRYPCYCRAAWVDPVDPEHILVGAADPVNRNGRVEESRDGGRSWTLTVEGMGAPWPHAMVERFVEVAGELLAVRSDGQLFVASPGSLRWRRALPEIARVNAATTMAD
jgi:photosystem II stability/assembly factor-like uncharacterized protein